MTGAVAPTGCVFRERTIDASATPEDGTLADEELIEAALVLLRDAYPGARWADPHAAA